MTSPVCTCKRRQSAVKTPIFGHSWAQIADWRAGLSWIARSKGRQRAIRDKHRAPSNFARPTALELAKTDGRGRKLAFSGTLGSKSGFAGRLRPLLPAQEGHSLKEWTEAWKSASESAGVSAPAGPGRQATCARTHQNADRTRPRPPGPQEFEQAFGPHWQAGLSLDLTARMLKRRCVPLLPRFGLALRRQGHGH
jgi:hypothetical protein